MAIDFKPQNALEQAIHDRNNSGVVYAIAEEEVLNTLAPAGFLGDECFSDEVVFSVLLISATQKQLEMMTNGWFWGHLKVGDRLRNLVKEALSPLRQDPSEGEKKLIKAIIYRDNEEIIRLIRDEKIKFYGFAPELLIMLPELSKAATLAFLQDGLSAKLKAIVFGIFLMESKKPDLLESFTYDERIKYTNLMIQILAGNPVAVDEPWYPEED